MDVLFGVVGDGFTLLVSDTSRVQSILVQRTEVDKILQLDSHKLLARSPHTALPPLVSLSAVAGDHSVCVWPRVDTRPAPASVSPTGHKRRAG